MNPQDPHFNPFPGLRPFQIEEKFLFFGREEQTAELLTRLRKTRFLAVVGVSGSGKSSLVRAGLLPELHGGTMATAGSSWEVAVMRPGGDPLTNLAEALIEADIHDADEEHVTSHVRTSLARSGMGLVDAIKQGDLPENTNLLLVVDQFEEIFRFRRMSGLSEEEAGHFITLLLEASEQIDLPIYVVLTMRSDFLGDCAQFRGLAESVNEGEYLIPRLNRNQRRQAIEGPVAVGQREITSRLVQRLLNDIGDDPDQLPILQHALMRTWDHWDESGADGPLDLDHYQATGGMDEALSRHADEVHAELPDDEHRWISEKLFKALTEKVDHNRGIRRPMQFRELCEIIEKDEDKIRTVVDAFRRQGRTFLMPSGEDDITKKTVIDISHESLMRAWRRLRDWVDDEAQSAKIYRRLADTSSLYQEGKAGYYRDPDLQIALSWREETKPNKSWADHYFAGFEEAMIFLDKSHDEAGREEREREEARQRELAQAQALAKAQQERAEAEQAKAEAMERLAITQRRRAVLATVLSVVAITASIVAGIAWKQAKESEEKAIMSLVSTQTLAEEDVEKAFEIISKEENGLARFADSMRSNASEFINNDDFNSAKVAIDAANKSQPRNLEGRINSALIHLEVADFKKATSEVGEFRKLATLENGRFSGRADHWTLGAMILVKANDVNGYQEYCVDLYKAFPHQQHNLVVKAFFVSELKDRMLFENAYNNAISYAQRETAAFRDWGFFHAGLAEFRKGDLKKTVEYANRSMNTPHNSANHELALKALNHSLLALVYNKEGSDEEAKKALEIAKYNSKEMRKLKLWFHDLYLSDLLIKECEASISN
jgi:energy-coupling factor transporter ATP-binding protein EcfA2